ncbi:hypothetical protein UCDDA912_g09103 [Diaporthe ampelina]|uniref:Uncharacterized protein n=1 Tax=Diaporthe ampelina TaxID=1214573 RepID=A0A0G2HS07_9PEZI|nr:hypothetical protein UCDDA912_g09103 [Diaporthe ampelina]
MTSSTSPEDAPAPTDTGFSFPSGPGVFGGGDDDDDDQDHKGNNFVGNSAGGGTSTRTSVDGVTTTVFITVTSVSTATERETLIKWATMTVRE